MATKNTKIFDLNLFSGSSELIRQFFRATYYDSGDGSVEFVSSEEAPPHPIESIIETNFQNSNELLISNSAYCSQKTILIDDTIKNNICLETDNYVNENIHTIDHTYEDVSCGSDNDTQNNEGFEIELFLFTKFKIWDYINFHHIKSVVL